MSSGEFSRFKTMVTGIHTMKELREVLTEIDISAENKLLTKNEAESLQNFVVFRALPEVRLNTLEKKVDLMHSMILDIHKAIDKIKEFK